MTELERASSSRRSAIRHPVVPAFIMAFTLLPKPGLGAYDLATMVALEVAPSVTSGPLRIEVEPTISDATVIPGWVRDRNPSVAEQVPFIEGHAQWIAVTISGATYDYRVSVVAVRDGIPLGPAKDPEVCECNSGALLERIDFRIAEELAVLRAAPPLQAASKPPPPEPVAGQEPETRSPDRHPRRLSPMGHTGVGVSVLGAGLLAAGFPFVLRPDEIRTERGLVETRSTRTSGVGLVAGGGVALAVGMSLLVADLVRQRQQTIVVAPMLDSRQLGIAITWRARGRVGR